VTKEVDMTVAGPFSLAKPDFSKTEVVKTYVYTTATVALAFDYWKETMEGKEGAQLSRMKTVRHTGSVFNPLHVLDNKISVSDILGLIAKNSGTNDNPRHSPPPQPLKGNNNSVKLIFTYAKAKD